MTRKSKIYLLLTFLITWGCWWSLSLLSSFNHLVFGEIPFWILYIIGGNGPFIAAFIVKKHYSSKEQYQHFTKQLLKIRNNFGWYLWIIMILSLQSAIPWVINATQGGLTEALFKQSPIMIILMLPAMIIGGGLEEVGWRGVLLPELLTKLSKFASAAVIGCIWALWHLPLWFIKGVPQQNSNFILFVLSVLGLSLLLTLLYDRTKSIFMCILFHGLTNSYANVLNTPDGHPYLASFAKLAFCLMIFAAFELFQKAPANYNSYIDE